MPAADGDSQGPQARRSLVRRSLVAVLGGVALLLVVRWVSCGHGGIVDCDSECYQRRWWAEFGVVPLITDVGETTLTVRLERYRDLHGSARFSYEHSLVYKNAVIHREILERGSRSSFPELDGLANLQMTLYSYWKLADDRP